MIPRNSVEISLTDSDFCEIVGNALENTLISNYGCKLRVNNVVKVDNRWVLAFVQTKKVR